MAGCLNLQWHLSALQLQPHIVPTVPCNLSAMKAKSMPCLHACYVTHDVQHRNSPPLNEPWMVPSLLGIWRQRGILMMQSTYVCLKRFCRGHTYAISLSMKPLQQINRQITVTDLYWKRKASNRTVLLSCTHTVDTFLKRGPEWGSYCLCVCVCVVKPDKSCLDMSSGRHNTLRKKVSLRRISGKTRTAVLWFLCALCGFAFPLLCLTYIRSTDLYNIFHPLHICIPSTL